MYSSICTRVLGCVFFANLTDYGYCVLLYCTNEYVLYGCLGVANKIVARYGGGYHAWEIRQPEYYNWLKVSCLNYSDKSNNSVVLRKHRRLHSRRVLHQSDHPLPHGASFCCRTKSRKRNSNIYMGSSSRIHPDPNITNCQLLPDSNILGSDS